MEHDTLPPQKGAFEQGWSAFLRVMAIVALGSALLYWAQLTGIYGEPDLRFDRLSPHGRVLFATLAVLMPAAALGLWLVARWGVVIWVMGLVAEIAAYGIWVEQFPPRPWVAGVNAIALLVLLLLGGALLVARYRAGAASED
ncbi:MULTISPECIES: DUF6163 family protein [unclassified Roseitalea]|uniref:DUF6163 family protein n=1 Tax=unclassified Roseitalea TaxID=2639107 RepID=UPI00273EE867|nr:MULTISPECIES: DUF6163 family protein [unclassified Roseitalea]